MVKKTVNQDDPTVYHLFYADEAGSPGADITFFEYPGVPHGRAGAGMVHRITFRVGSGAALDFWTERLRAEGVETERDGDRLRFVDPEGLGLELAAVETADEPLRAESPDIPAEHAIRGFDGVRAYARAAGASTAFLEEGLGFEPRGDAEWEVRGDRRGGWYAYDDAPEERGLGGAGTVHHVAWATLPDEQDAWRERVAATGASPTPVIDRFYFRSVYFREPNGILFELATIGPGFATDEPLESLGERLSLPPAFEHLRDELEPVLTPLPDVRPARR
jgi:glyoxalase family protein